MSVRQDQVQVQVEINGAKAGSTLKEMEATAKSLRRELKALPVDSEEFAAKASELQGVNTRLKEISNTIRGVDDGLKNAAGSGGFLKNALSTALGVFTGGALLDGARAAFNGIKDSIAGSIEKSNEAARAAVQLTQALNGNAEASKRLQDQANGLQQSLKGLVDDDDIVKAQARLAIYTKEADEIEKLTPLILDLATAKGVDLATAADAVGKSVEGNADGLKKLGISVKDAGTEQERLKIITEGLTAAVGGQAQVVADSGTSGWQRFKNALGEFMEDVGTRLTPVISAIGNFFADLIQKGGPLIDIFKGAAKAVNDAWIEVKALLIQMGLLSDKTSLADTVIKALKFTITIATDIIKLFARGIQEVVQGFNTMVAVGVGTVEAITAAFTGFKDFFVNIFSSIGQVLKGVFTLDIADIQQGLAGFKSSFTNYGSEVSGAYNKGYDRVRAEQKAARDLAAREDEKKEVDQATAHGTNKAKAESDADKKAREKAAADRLKAQAELNQKLLDLQQQVEDAQVAALQDGIDKELAQEDVRYRRELAAFTKKVNDLRKAGADENTIQAENIAFREAAEEAHVNKIIDIDSKYRLKQIEEAKKTAEEIKKQNEAIYKGQVDATNEFYGQLINAVNANALDQIQQVHGNEDEITRIKQEAADAQLEIEIQKLEELKRINEEAGKATADIEEQIIEKRIEQEERFARVKTNVEQQVRQTIKDGLDFAIAALGQDEQARKKNAAAIKAFSIAKVLIDLQEEIQSIWKTANENPSNILFPGSGNVIAGIKSALAVGRATFAVAKITQQSFAKGGRTRGMGLMDDDGQEVAGVVHANEWVAPEWMNNHPVYSTIINRLEDARVRGFADGGFTTTPVAGAAGGMSGISDELLLRIASAVEAWPTVTRAQVVYSEFESVQQDVQTVRSKAAIG